MTDAGYIIIQRRLLKDPLLCDDAYFRAWLWLVSEAAWKSRRVISHQRPDNRDRRA